LFHTYLCHCVTGTPLIAKDNPGAFWVILGPGLPTFEDLGLTAADLLTRDSAQMTEPSPFNSTTSATLHPRAATCTGGNERFNCAWAISCREALKAMGKAPCGAQTPSKCWTMMCTAGMEADWVYVYGASKKPNGGPAQSYCRDAAHAVNCTMEHCKIDGKMVKEGL